MLVQCVLVWFCLGLLSLEFTSKDLQVYFFGTIGEVFNHCFLYFVSVLHFSLLLLGQYDVSINLFVVASQILCRFSLFYVFRMGQFNISGLQSIDHILCPLHFLSGCF